MEAERLVATAIIQKSIIPASCLGYFLCTCLHANNILTFACIIECSMAASLHGNANSGSQVFAVRDTFLQDPYVAAAGRGGAPI